jgi:hypothetical protein
VSAPLTLAVVLAVVIPVAVHRAYHPARDIADRWAAEHGLELTAANRPLVVRYLRRVRILRTWGAVAGALLPTLVEFAVDGRFVVLGFGTDGDSAPLAFGTIFIGYLAGALIAEVSLPRPEPGVARLVRRELGDYLPRWAALAQRALAAAAIAGFAATAFVPYPDGVDEPTVAALALGATVISALAAGLETLERWLVRRPQPYTGPSEVAADDAIRAQSIRAVAGAGLALLLLACAGAALMLQGSDVALLKTVMVVPAAACVVLALLVCQGLGETAWRVRHARAASA